MYCGLHCLCRPVCLNTVFDLITAPCAYVFQNYWENLLVKYAPNKGTL